MAPLEIEERVITALNTELSESLKGDTKITQRETASRRIQLILEGIAEKLSLPREVKMFGSFSNGFKTGSSDLDVVFLGTVSNGNTIPLLRQFADMVPKFGFENVTQIFQANVPLLKFTDMKSSMEVDFCINNELGVRNSQLLRAYCEYDYRVLQLGRLVKDWAKQHELVGTADGCLNSYAYMLLVIQFLQCLPVPVVPNLQQDMEAEDVWITDTKWGCDDVWNTKFCGDVANLPASKNTMSVGELLIRFFHFYTCIFDWRNHAVCMRLSRPKVMVDKYSLKTPTNDDMWYVEDPFDLKHNLAGKCTRAGRNRILDEMRTSLAAVQQPGGWARACPPMAFDSFFLKCRITMGVTPQALLEKFEDCELVKLHFPKPDSAGRMGQAYLEFGLGASRRRAHAKNDTYIMDCQLQMHYSNQNSFQEAMNQGFQYSTYEMASFQMQRQVLAARVGFNPPDEEAPQRPPPTFGAAAAARPAHGLPGGPCGMMPGLMPGAGAGACGGETVAPFGFHSGPLARGPHPFPPHLAMQHMADLASPWQAAAQATAASAAATQQAAQQGAQGAQQQQLLRLAKAVPEPVGRPDSRAKEGRTPPAKNPGSRPPAATQFASNSTPTKPSARFANGSRASQVTQDTNACWVFVPIEFDGVLPKGSKQVFDEEFVRKLEGALQFVNKHKAENTFRNEEPNPNPAGDYHTLQLEVHSGTTPGQGPAWSTAFSTLLQDAHGWFEKPQNQARKPVSGATTGVSKAG